MKTLFRFLRKTPRFKLMNKQRQKEIIHSRRYPNSKQNIWENVHPNSKKKKRKKIKETSRYHTAPLKITEKTW